MANLVASERVRLDMTQAELAEEASVSKSTVERWESGAIPSGCDLITLHEIFGCSVDYLLGLTDNRKMA